MQMDRTQRDQRNLDENKYRKRAAKAPYEQRDPQGRGNGRPAQPESGRRSGSRYVQPESGKQSGSRYVQPKSGKRSGSRYMQPESGMQSGNRYAQPQSGRRPAGRYAQPESGKRPAGRYAQPESGKRSGSRDVQPESGGRVRSEREIRRKNGSKNIRSTGKRTASKLFFVILIALLLVCGVGTIILYRSQNSRMPKEITVSLDTLDSPNAVLIDAASGTVIGSKNAQERIYPASMVKIMTVLTAIREIRNLNATTEMSYDYYDMLYARDASRAGFEPGEKAVIRDLLYGALLPSGAECCMELALQAAGSESTFVEKMNQNAAKLGLTQTQFTNCTGLHDEGQYSTPAEIAAILQDALKNKTFYKVFTTKTYTVEPTEVHPEGFTFQSSMFKGMQSPTVIGGEIMGGKTGYTDDAGHCLASMARIGGREYILVTAGWAQNPRVDQYHINDAFLAYNALGRALETE